MQLLTVTLVCVAVVAAQRNGEICDASSSRTDCGTLEDKPVFHQPFERRVLTSLFVSCSGYLGITQDQCEGKGCCWSPESVRKPILTACVTTHEHIDLQLVMLVFSIYTTALLPPLGNFQRRNEQRHHEKVSQTSMSVCS